MPKFVRFLLCFVVFVATWELCARVEDYLEEGAPLFGNYAISAMLTHDDVGVVGRPYGHFGKWKLNALGYRGPDIHPNTVRIISVGASETFGMYESPGNEFPRQLERVMNARRPDLHVEVVNTAYAGQSLRTFAHRVDKIVDTVSPSMAVFYPSFFDYLNDKTLGQPDPLEWVQEPQGFHSRILGKLLPQIDHMPQWAEDLRFRFHIWRALQKAPATKQVVPESNVDQFRADLRASLDKLQQRHVKPVLITHATFFGRSVEPEERYMLTAWRRFEPNLSDEGFLDVERRMNAVIRQEAQARHLTLVEAAEVMSGPENFADWVHFTNRGATRMAHLVTEKLISTDLGRAKQRQSFNDGGYMVQAGEN